jgi:hypothetical protein
MSAVDSFLEKKAEIDKEGSVFSKILSAGTPAAIGSQVAGSGFKDSLKRGVNQLAVAGVLGAGIVGGETAFNTAMSAISKARGFKKMVSTNPELQEMDSTKVKNIYNTLHRFNPEMASDPFVAGSFVKSTAEYDNIPTRTINELIAARSRTARPSIFEGAGATVGIQAARDTYADDPIRVMTQSAMQSTGRELADKEFHNEKMERIRDTARNQEIGKASATDPGSLAYQQQVARRNADDDFDSHIAYKHYKL